MGDDTGKTIADTGAATLDGSDSWSGRRLSHYLVGERLGGGGMGVVYRASDTRLGRAVAIKVLSPTLAADPQARTRFAREARAASALDHPNIGTIYEIDEHEGAAFIVMALYEGETLRDRIARGPVPLDELERIFQQLVSALGVAHKAGIAHRDVKPANIFLAEGGQLKLLDFGLAKLLANDAAADTLTAEGAIVGTLLYMAPEQLRGVGVDHRADLWALGVILYELLAGKTPFAGAGQAVVVTRILHEEPAPIRTLRADVPVQLEALVSRLLCKDPLDRLGDSGEISQALSGVPLAKAPRPRRRGRLRLLLSLLALVVAGAGTGAALLLRRPPPAATHIPARTDAELDLMRATYQEATREFDLKHYEAAARGFESVWAGMGDPAALFNAAQAWRQAGKRERGELLLKNFLSANPDIDPETRAQVEQRLEAVKKTPAAPATAGSAAP